MLRLEARNSQTPIERKPPWIKTRLRTGPHYAELKRLVRSEGLHTVCEEAGCPNIFECWEDREATFLIGGEVCTRRCDFCQIATGKPGPLDAGEPRRVAESVAAMGLRYATVTGVARDDLPDGGAWLYAQACREIHAAVPGCGVELLIPDFDAAPDRLAEVFGARPEVLAHNIETVPRIFRRIRPGFRYHPVERWLPPAEFDELGAEARELGFAGVMAGPLVRSSYRAGRLYRQAMDAQAASR